MAARQDWVGGARPLGSQDEPVVMRAKRYRITICGRLDEALREVFGDFDITPDGMNTVLTGGLDQAALHGAINRIRSFGLELAEIILLADSTI